MTGRTIGDWLSTVDWPSAWIFLSFTFISWRATQLLAAPTCQEEAGAEQDTG